MKNLFFAAAFGIAELLTACAHDQAPTTTPTRDPATQTSDVRPVGNKTDETRVYVYANVPCAAGDAGSSATATASRSATIDRGGDGGNADAPLTDDQILQVARTANTAEVMQAQLAHIKSHDARVQRLAASTIRDKQETDTQGAVIAKKESLRPDTSPESMQLEAQTGGTLRTLKVETGAEFNKSYVDAQVRQDQTVLRLLDGKLIPDSQAPDLRAYLQRMKSSAEGHLDRAIAVRQQLER
jgi:predicted outer membrane protein